MPTSSVINQAESGFKKGIEHLKHEYSSLQVGRAHSGLVDFLEVEAYGQRQSIKSVASISIPDSRTIQIQPWDKSTMGAIEQAVRDSDIGINPVNNGLAVILNIPLLTEERRSEIVKVVKKMAEEAKITIRQHRQTAHAAIKKLEDDKSVSEDEGRLAEKHLQEKVDASNLEVEETMKKKENDVMTI